MFYILPTKNGLGIELWGDYNDLTTIHDIIDNLWGDELNNDSYISRSKIISNFNYNVRKAYQGQRLTKVDNGNIYFGTKFTWVYIIFFIHSIRENTKIIESSKLDLGFLLQFEYMLEQAMFLYDKVGANEVKKYITAGIYSENPHIYLFMLDINNEYISMKRGKVSFRKLPEILKKGVIVTQEYNDYYTFLQSEAKRYGVNINELDLDDIINDDTKW
ncbi:MAG: hypothetical protein H6Q15_1465 [Bacteroidetes bacterium]|nr:hypothetical protein [Bacteroidota bacterium]